MRNYIEKKIYGANFQKKLHFFVHFFKFRGISRLNILIFFSNLRNYFFKI